MKTECVYCGEEFPNPHRRFKYCSKECRMKAKTKRATHRRNNDEKLRIRHLRLSRESWRRTSDKKQKLIYDHYGRECVWCGQKYEKALTLDHIKNDGGKKRKQKRARNTKALVWRNYQENGIWPIDIQVLCFTCNCTKQLNDGILPQELKNQLR